MADRLLAPGEQVQPQIDLPGAVELAEKLYGVKVESAKELDGYDDKNYFLKVTQPPNNKFIPQLWLPGYVLKIMNSSDSKKLDYVAAQCEIVMHLDKHGIKTPVPQKNIHGDFYCVVELESEDTENAKIKKEHVVRMMTFQEGTLMKDIPWSYELHYEVGRYTAKIDLILKEFHHPAYEQYSSIWLLKNFPHVKKFLFVLNDERKASMVKDVIEDFDERVLRRYSTLKLGVIHGDIHDQNLLYRQNDSGNWEISAVLDLGDSHHSAYVLELALAMTYMMIQSETVQSGAHVVAGYCSSHPLPLDQLKLLKVCVCARLCQSLVLGLYTHSQCPANEYVLTTQAAGWRLLQMLWSRDSTELEDIWLSQL